MEPLITVVVPVYNVEKYLDKCVESIVNQTYQNLEIILVDDGSPDNCPQMCDEWAKKDSRIKVIHKENGGLSSARNAGIKACTGEYITFVDSDDYIDLELVNISLAKIIANHSDVCVYNFDFLDSQYEHIENAKYHPAEYHGQNVLHNYLKITSFGASACNKLYSAELIKSNNLFFDESIKWGEDHRFNYYVFKNAKNVIVIENALYYYLDERSGSITNQITANSVRRWKLTKFIIEQEEGNYESLKILYEVYAKELVCILRELIKSNKQELINDHYNEITDEIKKYYSNFMNDCKLPKVIKYSIKLINVSPKTFKVLYMIYTK